MFWKVRATPVLRRRWGAMAVMSTPPRTIFPALTGKTPQIRLTVVLFPDPLGPMRPKMRPCGTLRSRASTAWTPPKFFDRPLS
jgi:hypothetical protein